jgi:hypothetical protein
MSNSSRSPNEFRIVNEGVKTSKCRGPRKSRLPLPGAKPRVRIGGQILRQVAVGEASFYVWVWKKGYGKPGLTELRELRKLRDDSTRLI